MWHRLVAAQPAPPAWLVWAGAAFAVLVVTDRRSWRISRNVVTIAHESGHALVALLTGRRLAGIRLHSDTSGVTVSVGKRTGPGMILTAAAGYPAPPLLGLGGAWLLSGGHVTALLWISLVLLNGMLFVIRNAYGALCVLVADAAVFSVSWLAPAIYQEAFAYLIAWFLLVAGARPVVELQRSRRRGRRRGHIGGIRGGVHPGLQGPDSDADQLSRLTGVPAVAWVILFGAVALAALLAGARWLLPHLTV